MGFTLTPRSMTLDDLELWIFSEFLGIRQYCNQQRCKNVDLEQFLACFRVARVCQRQLGFLSGYFFTQKNLFTTRLSSTTE